MAYNKSGLACLFICLLMFDALSTQAIAAPLKSRQNKGISLSQAQAKQAAKHIALPAKILLKKGDENCGEEPPKSSHSTCRRTFSRCYETIGSCKTWIDVVENSMDTVDTVVTEDVCVKELSEHETRFDVLTNTKTHRKFLRHVSADIETFTTVHKEVQTIVPVSVTISVLTTESVCIGKLTNKSTWIQELESECTSIRFKTEREVNRREVTSTEGVIKAIKRVHENIAQEAPRSVTCQSRENSSQDTSSCNASNNASSCNASNNASSCNASNNASCDENNQSQVC